MTTHKLILIAVAGLLMLLAPRNTSARAEYTCSGGKFFIDVQSSDGTWTCWATNLTCSGEWTYTVERRADVPNPPGYRRSSNIPAARVSEIARMVAILRKEDVIFAYRASDRLLSSYHRRGRFATGTLTFSSSSVAHWLSAGLDSGNFGNGSSSKGVCPGDLYPNPKPGGGTNCYPCLGCAPCGDSYCSIYRIGLTQDDLSSSLEQEGYAVKNKRITRPKKR
jgi:hypothetical protein